MIETSDQLRDQITHLKSELEKVNARYAMLVGACAEAQKHIERAWKSTEHVEFSDAMKDATATLKAIGEVKP